MNPILTTTEELIYLTKVHHLCCYLLDPVITYQPNSSQRFGRTDFWSNPLKTKIAINPEEYLTQVLDLGFNLIEKIWSRQNVWPYVMATNVMFKLEWSQMKPSI